MKRLFKYLINFKNQITLILILTLVQAFAELFLPALMANIVNIGIVNNDTAYIMRTGGVMLAITIVGMFATIYSSLLSAKTSAGFGQLIRSKIFRKVESFSLNEFDDKGTASLITRTTNDINQVRSFTVMGLRIFLRAPLMAVGAVTMAVTKDVTLSLILLVVVLLVGIAISIVAKKTIPIYKSVQLKIDKLNLVLRERLTGIRVIRAFRKENFEKEKFHEANDDLTQTTIKVNKIMATLMPMMSFTFHLVTVAIVWFGSSRINDGFMQVGDLMAFIQYAMMIMFSLMMLTMIFIMIPKAAASATRINEVLDVESVINDPVKNIKTEKIGYVQFKDVSFKYKGAQECVIENVSFTACPGETTAIIGSTGSGKSTILNLIPRFYDVHSGSILVDGVDIRDMYQDELRSKIGLVPQKALLFTGTIAENIKYGKKDATEIEMAHAAKVSQSLEFINSSAEGFDTQVSQGGTNLSGGQKQRLSIARAVIRKPEIYIFDDSFSALDFKTGAKLRHELASETENSTVIVVAQRVTSIMGADRIIVLESGKVSGIGTHKELLSTNTVYKEIVMSQLSEEEIS